MQRGILFGILGHILLNVSSSAGLRNGECTKPADTPTGIPITFTTFTNWDKALNVGLWVAQPRDAEDVVQLANWAYPRGYKLRATGAKHSWAPVTVTEDENCKKTLLVDMTQNLKEITLSIQDNGEEGVVSVGAGVQWEELLTVLESNGQGVFGYPEVGNVTVAGTLAVGAHGTGISLQPLPPGLRDGSVADLVTELDAVVWDSGTDAYVLKNFQKSDQDTAAFLVHLGRAIITRVSLTTGRNFNLRCRCLTNISAETVFGYSAENLFSMSNLVSRFGRVDAQLYPYTTRSMIRIWNEEEQQTDGSTVISAPYPFTHPESKPADQQQEHMSLTVPSSTPLAQELKYNRDVVTLARTKTADVWGPSKNSLLYYSSKSWKWRSIGHVVLTSRENIQKVVHQLYSFFKKLATKFAVKGEFPMNQPVQVRVTGMDKPRSGNKAPSLSLVSPVENQPQYDVAVYFGLHSYTGTKNLGRFMEEWEKYLFQTFNTSSTVGTARVEWSKMYAFTDKDAWTNWDILGKILPKTFGSQWEWAISKLNQYDPHKVFTNEFLDRLFGTTHYGKY